MANNQKKLNFGTMPSQRVEYTNADAIRAAMPRMIADVNKKRAERKKFVQAIRNNAKAYNNKSRNYDYVQENDATRSVYSPINERRRSVQGDLGPSALGIAANMIANGFKLYDDSNEGLRSNDYYDKNKASNRLQAALKSYNDIKSSPQKTRSWQIAHPGRTLEKPYIVNDKDWLYNNIQYVANDPDAKSPIKSGGPNPIRFARGAMRGYRAATNTAKLLKGVQDTKRIAAAARPAVIRSTRMMPTKLNDIVKPASLGLRPPSPANVNEVRLPLVRTANVPARISDRVRALEANWARRMLSKDPIARSLGEYQLLSRDFNAVLKPKGIQIPYRPNYASGITGKFGSTATTPKTPEKLWEGLYEEKLPIQKPRKAYNSPTTKSFSPSMDNLPKGSVVRSNGRRIELPNGTRMTKDAEGAWHWKTAEQRAADRLKNPPKPKNSLTNSNNNTTPRPTNETAPTPNPNSGAESWINRQRQRAKDWYSRQKQKWQQRKADRANSGETGEAASNTTSESTAKPNILRRAKSSYINSWREHPYRNTFVHTGLGVAGLAGADAAISAYINSSPSYKQKSNMNTEPASRTAEKIQSQANSPRDTVKVDNSIFNADTTSNAAKLQQTLENRTDSVAKPRVTNQAQSTSNSASEQNNSQGSSSTNTSSHSSNNSSNAKSNNSSANSSSSNSYSNSSTSKSATSKQSTNAEKRAATRQNRRKSHGSNNYTANKKLKESLRFSIPENNSASLETPTPAISDEEREQIVREMQDYIEKERKRRGVDY